MAKSKSRSTIYEVSVHPEKNANIEAAIKQFGNASGFFKTAANFYITALNNATPPLANTPSDSIKPTSIEERKPETAPEEHQLPEAADLTTEQPVRKRRLGTGGAQSFKAKYEE